MEHSASPHRFSRGSDTKTTLSAGDITAISPAVLAFCVHPSPLWLGSCVIPLSEHTARMKRSLHYVLNVPLKCLFPQLTGDKERRRRCKLWWIRISPSLTTRASRRRIKSHAPSRAITNYTCRVLALQCWSEQTSELLISSQKERSNKSRRLLMFSQRRP